MRHSIQPGVSADELTARPIAGAPHRAVNLLRARGVDLAVLDQGIGTSIAVERMFFKYWGRSLSSLLSRHALMSERRMDGLAAARARTGGHKPKLGPRQVKLAREMYEELGEDGMRKYTVAQIAAEFGVTCPTP